MGLQVDPRGSLAKAALEIGPPTASLQRRCCSDEARERFDQIMTKEAQNLAERKLANPVNPVLDCRKSAEKNKKQHARSCRNPPRQVEARKILPALMRREPAPSCLHPLRTTQRHDQNLISDRTRESKPARVCAAGADSESGRRRRHGQVIMRSVHIAGMTGSLSRTVFSAGGLFLIGTRNVQRAGEACNWRMQMQHASVRHSSARHTIDLVMTRVLLWASQCHWPLIDRSINYHAEDTDCG